MRDDDIVDLVRQCIDESPRIIRIENDVSTLKGDVSTLKGDVSELKGDVSTLKLGVANLEAEFHLRGLMWEDMQTTLRKVLDTVTLTSERLEELKMVRETVDRHGNRLDAVEGVLKAHIKNRLAHRSVGPGRGKGQ